MPCPASSEAALSDPPGFPSHKFPDKVCDKDRGQGKIEEDLNGLLKENTWERPPWTGARWNKPIGVV